MLSWNQMLQARLPYQNRIFWLDYIDHVLLHPLNHDEKGNKMDDAKMNDVNVLVHNMDTMVEVTNDKTKVDIAIRLNMNQ